MRERVDYLCSMAKTALGNKRMGPAAALLSRSRDVALACAWLVLASVPVAAQSFRTYECADGSRFAAGFYPSDTHAHLQIDGKAISLRKKLSFSGSRYSGSGITLFLTPEGAVLKRRQSPSTACTPY